MLVVHMLSHLSEMLAHRTAMSNLSTSPPTSLNPFLELPHNCAQWFSCQLILDLIRLTVKLTITEEDQHKRRWEDEEGP